VRTFLALIGASWVALWFMGSIDMIDFKFCIAPAGTCTVEVRK